MDDREIPRGVATPPSGTVEVTFDGACERTRDGPIATYGFTVDGGGFRFEDRGLAVRPFAPHATNNVAEYAGAICALEWLARRGYTGDLVVSGDSQLVIRQMLGEYEVRAEHLVPYHERFGQLARTFRKVEYRWIRREANTRADALSKQAVREALRELEGS